MKILQETTKNFPCHTYMIDGYKTVAYKKNHEGDWIRFPKPLMFDKRNRTFKELK